jgi:hypothetical protein
MNIKLPLKLPKVSLVLLLIVTGSAYFNIYGQTQVAGQSSSSIRILNEFDISNFHFSTSDIMSLQFYISKTLVLKRNSTEIKTQTDNSGHIVSGLTIQYDDEITIPRMTPGIASKVILNENNKGTIYVDFGNDIVIPFTVGYGIHEINYSVNYGSSSKNSSRQEIFLNGIEYIVDVPKSERTNEFWATTWEKYEFVYLLADLSKFTKVDNVIKKETAPGRVISQ